MPNLEEEDEERTNRLGELYKILYAHRANILSKFDDRNISDDDYFHYGVSYDIVSNALNIVMSRIIECGLSTGIDNNARAIIEGFVILDIDKNGEINDDMKRIYRLSYAAVERANEGDLFNKGGFVSLGDQEQRKKDYQELLDVASRRFHCSKAELRDSIVLDDPYFFLLTRLDNKTNFESIIRSHSIDKEEFDDAYSFFSTFIHPLTAPRDEAGYELYTKREKYITELMKRVLDFVESDLPQVRHENIRSYASRLASMKDTLIKYISKTSDIFEKIRKYFSTIENPYVASYAMNAEFLYVDLFVCYFFKLYELVTPKFKTLVEMVAVIEHFVKEPDRNIALCESIAMTFSSIYHLRRWTDKLDEFLKHEDELETVYRVYYSQKYSVNGFNGLKYMLEHSTLYAIGGPNYSFRDLVRDMKLEELSDEARSMIYPLYRVSLDMEHASGYSFNQTADVSEYNAIRCTSLALDLLSVTTRWIESIIQTEHPNVNFDSERSFLRNSSRKLNGLAAQIGRNAKG